MLFFMFYAVIVWYVIARHRRTLLGFALTIASGLGVAVVGYVHYEIGRWSNGRIQITLMQEILYPYGGFVVLMGLYIACLPRRSPEGHCGSCGYNLAGLEESGSRTPERVGDDESLEQCEGVLCPECGVWRSTATPRGVPQAMESGTSLPATQSEGRRGQREGSAADHAVGEAKEQDQAWHPRDEHPAEDREVLVAQRDHDRQRA